jgi:AraC-like DNA-binding protein
VNTVNCYEPEAPRELASPWLRLGFEGRVYTPRLVRIRKRIFSVEMIRSLNPQPYVHSHLIYHLVFYLDGGNTVLVDGRRLGVRAGQMLLINPGVQHDVLPREPRGCSFLTLMFTYQNGARHLSLPFGQLLGRLLGTQLDPQPVVDDNSGALHSFFACLEQDVLERREKDLERVSFCLAGIFNALQGLCLRPIPGKAIPDDVLAVQHYLLENLDQPVTIRDLTRVAHLSRSYLIAKFKQCCGMSPIDFLIHSRIEKAKTYLQHSSKRIKEIAWLCGFRSEFYFCKIFKKRVGQTPGEFRRKNTGTEYDGD